MSTLSWGAFCGAVLAVAILSSQVSAQVSQTWVAKYTGSTSPVAEATEVAFLPGGDCVIAGYCSGPGTQFEDLNFLTIRYDAQGNQIWAQRYDGPRHDADMVEALAVDGAGNVIVAGVSKGTLLSPTDLALATIKYAPDGTVLWTRRFERLGPYYYFEDAWGGMAVDAAGNVYVAGNTHANVPAAPLDMVTVAYDPAGTLLWTAMYDGPTGDYDYAQDLALSAAGQVIVVGRSQDVSGTTCTTLSYDSNGTLLWTASEPTGSYTRSHVAVDAAGRVYVAASQSVGAAGGYDLLVLAYDSSGNPLWKTLVAGPGTNEERPCALRPGPSGDLYVTGQTLDFLYSTTDLVTLRLGPDGDLLWTKIYGQFDTSEIPRDIEVDADGNAYVTGETSFFTTGSNWRSFLTLKYSPAGSRIWGIKFGEPTPPFQMPNATANALELSSDASFLIVTGIDIGLCTTLRYDQPSPPVVYCTSKASSIAGCTPSVGSSSSLASLSAGPGSCSVVCAPVPGGIQPAIALASTGGPLVPPLANAFGWECIAPGPASFRVPAALPSGTGGHCDGLYEFDVGGWLTSQSGNPALPPGGTLDLQVWYRDPPSLGGANLSNALAFELVP